MSRCLYSQGMTTSTTSEASEPKRTPQEMANGRRYNVQLALSIGAYTVLLALAIFLVPDDSPTVAQRALAATPALAGLGILAAYLRFFRGLDELQQLIQLKALAVGFGVAMVSALALGLASFPGDPSALSQFAPMTVFSLGMAGWGVAVGRFSNQVGVTC